MNTFDPGKFTFVRIVYDSVGGPGEAWYQGDRGWIPRWATDHPDGAKNLTWRLNQLATIQANVANLSQVNFRGLIDPAGRLAAVATRNTDIADGWGRGGC